MSNKIRVGISACLLGEKVRYDGGHKLDHYLKDTIGVYVEWVPVCPEVGAGLPIPREPMRLVEKPGSLQIITVNTGINLTDLIRAWSEKWLTELLTTDLRGFVFKSGSPSCGVKDVEVFTSSGQPNSRGTGIFCAAFVKHFPLLAVADEGSLQDTKLRNTFFDRLGCSLIY